MTPADKAKQLADEYACARSIYRQQDTHQNSQREQALRQQLHAAIDAIASQVEAPAEPVAPELPLKTTRDAPGHSRAGGARNAWAEGWNDARSALCRPTGRA
jgi:hypothetical protein